ncbi:MAG: substrate-binding domain-containing protein [Acidimicrobiales bacterium]
MYNVIFRRLRPRIRLAMAAIGVGALGIGSLGITSTAGASASKSTSKSAVSKTVAEAIGAKYPVKKLPKVVRLALTKATKPLTHAQLNKAFACWKATSCTLGKGNLVLGQADGNDINTWRAFAKMNGILQALEYPQIGKYIFTNAQGNLSTFESNIRELVAEGAKMIIAYNTFGPAAYPAFEAAQRAGAFVSTYVGPATTAPASAISARVQPTICAVGKTMAKITKKLIGSSPVAYFTGTPGNPEDAGWQKCATNAGINSVFNATTTWTPAGAGKAASALIASGKTIKAILYSYSTPVPNIVQSYKTAGKTVPAIVTWTTNNSTACLMQHTTFPLYITNALNWAARVSVTATLLRVQHKHVPQAVLYPQPFVKATAAMCTPSAPAGYPGTSALVPASLTQKMLSATK